MANQKGLRKNNKAIVFQTIAKFAPISRKEISERTNLSPALVTIITEELKRQSFILETGTANSTGGRPPVFLEIYPHAGYVIGINLGMTYISTLLMDFSLQPIHKLKIPTLPHEGKDAVINRILEAIEKIIILADVPREKVLAIGIGVPGLVDTKNGVSKFSPNLGWHNVPIRELLYQRIKIPVLIENDVRCATLGEKFFGAGKGVDNLVCMYVGIGIGAGIIIDGKLYKGVSEGAGEIGHTTILDDGPRCSCGNRGCLEAIASGPAIARRAKESIEKGRKSLIYDLVEGKLEKITGEIVSRAGWSGDPLALEILKDTGHYLGIGIANLINLFNPELLILGGGVMQAGELIMNSLRETLKERVFSMPAEAVKIVFASLGNEAGMTGAAKIAMDFAYQKLGLLI